MAVTPFQSAATQKKPTVSTTGAPAAQKPAFSAYGGRDNYVNSQGDRYRTAAVAGDTDLMSRLEADAKRAGYALPDVSRVTGRSGGGGGGLPAGLDWLGAGANNEVDAQLAAYRGQQQAARDALQAGLDANNAFLDEQLAALGRQQAVDMDALQQQQNRFGGLYSGGLNYQGGQINRGYADARGGLTRDVNNRNQALIDQYGAQAQTLAQQIADLQSAQPQIINERIQQYMNDYANLYGTNPLTGQQTAAYQGQLFNQGLANKQANLDAALQYGQQTGYVLSPQSDWSGFGRQIASGKTSQGNPLIMNLAGRQFAASEQQRMIDNTFRQRQADIDNAYQQGQLSLAQAQEARMQLQQQLDDAYRWAGLDFDMSQAAGAGQEYNGLTSAQVLNTIQQQYADPTTGKLPADNATREQVYLNIVDSRLPDDQIDQLLSVVGLTKKEIDAFNNKYGVGK